MPTIVEALAGVVEDAARVEGVGVGLGDAGVEIEDEAGNERVVARRDAGLEEKGTVGAHLMMVGEDRRPPTVEELVARAGLGVG